MQYSIGRRITTLTLEAVDHEDQGSRLLLMRGTTNLDLVLMISLKHSMAHPALRDLH